MQWQHEIEKMKRISAIARIALEASGLSFSLCLPNEKAGLGVYRLIVALGQARQPPGQWRQSSLACAPVLCAAELGRARRGMPAPVGKIARQGIINR